MAKTRKKFSNEHKTKIVKKLIADAKKNPTVSITGRAHEVGVNPTVLRRWVRDPRYGGGPGLFRRGEPGRVRRTLPTEERKIVRAKPLIATRFECPHCGGAIIRGGNNA